MDYILQGRTFQYQPPNPSTPTMAQPGSIAKLLVMTERHQSGQPLHDPGDAACITAAHPKFTKKLLFDGPLGAQPRSETALETAARLTAPRDCG